MRKIMSLLKVEDSSNILVLHFRGNNILPSQHLPGGVIISLLYHHYRSWWQLNIFKKVKQEANRYIVDIPIFCSIFELYFLIAIDFFLLSVDSHSYTHCIVVVVTLSISRCDKSVCYTTTAKLDWKDYKLNENMYHFIKNII